MYRLTQNFSRYIVFHERKNLKRISTYLNWTKCYETNICDSDEQKHVSHTESHNFFLIYYGLWLGWFGLGCRIKGNCLHVGHGPAVECNPWRSFLGIVARIHASFGQKPGIKNFVNRALSIRFIRHTKVFRYLTAYRRVEVFKIYYNIFILL